MPAVRCDIYAQAEDITGLSHYTLKDLASTARRFPPSVRTDALSWTHHRTLINALPKADDATLARWLKRAIDENLSADKLKKAILSPKGSTAKSFRVSVSLSTWETLKDFADNERSVVQKVATKWIEEQAQTQQTQTLRKIAKQETEERRYQKRRKVGIKVAHDYDPLKLRGD
jgi:hypothetical protein